MMSLVLFFNVVPYKRVLTLNVRSWVDDFVPEAGSFSLQAKTTILLFVVLHYLEHGGWIAVFHHPRLTFSYCVRPVWDHLRASPYVGSFGHLERAVRHLKRHERRDEQEQDKRGRALHGLRETSWDLDHHKDNSNDYTNYVFDNMAFIASVAE